MMKLKILIAFCLHFFLVICVVSAQQKHSFSLGDAAFLLDGKPFQMISGELHYTRIPKEYWKDRMKMAKAMGLNTIGTYVFWNAHEPVQGKYDFYGNNDIASFLETAKEEGLWVVLRPSPYACAEWEFGGYPWWLLKDSTVKVRSKDKRFIAAYKNYIKALSKQLVPHLVTNGGNVLMVQVENEYGSYNNDKSYLELNKNIFRDAGFNCILFTCDGADKMENGYLPGYLPAVNGLDDTTEVKKLINKFHNGKGPYYIAEWYPGWFDQWGKQHANVSAERNAQILDKVLSAGISINMYMFHGGSTRDFMNGANMNVREPYAPQVSSYDYDAPLDEAGNPTKKYFKFREVIAKHLPPGTVLPSVPERKKAITINEIKLTGYAALFNNLPKPVTAKKPLPFEELAQAYGFVLYRTNLSSSGSSELMIGKLRDYAIVYSNGKKEGVLDRRLEQESLQLNDVSKNATLDILVENNGRINYGPYLTDNRKGILGKVTLGGKELNNWKIYSLPFQHLRNIRFTSMPITNEQSAFYKGNFVLNEVGDTFLDMRSFGKGFVFLNGHNLGKYWNIGPQRTLYVPACWLKKAANEIIVFDELKTGHAAISSLANPILNQQTAADK
jgi:beta-galactosidase